MQTYYYYDGARQMGPYTLPLFHALVKQGTINAKTPVCREGATEWTTWEALSAELEPAPRHSSPVPPPPAPPAPPSAPHDAPSVPRPPSVPAGIPATPGRQFPVTTTESLPQGEISEVLGIVSGSIVKTRHVGKHMLAGLKSLLGGELDEYTRLEEEAKAQALQRMTDRARAMGADAVVGMRFMSADIFDSVTEVCAYGTAVRID